MTQAQIDSLLCVAPYLELDFQIRGFTVPSEWDGYTAWTNLPGAIHDVATSDYATDVSSPGVTRIHSAQLQAGVQYQVSVAFDLPLSPSGGEPRVSVQWAPSYWAASLPQQAFCTLWRPLMGDAECIFPRATAKLSRAYNNNESFIFDGYRWWEFSSTTPTSPTPPTEPSPIPTRNPFGVLDNAELAANQSNVRVRGWALDPDTTGSIAVHTYIDGVYAGATTANSYRPDVGTAYPGFGNNHGFEAQYAIGVGTHQVCAYAINVDSGSTNPQLPSCKTVKRTDRINELAFVRTNHGSGQTELAAWHGSPNYTTLYSSTLTGYPAISDPQWVKPLAIDTNGDGIDELGFVRFNHSSGRTELSLWHGAPHYTTLLTTTLTGYPAIGDPQNVMPLALDTNGDGIDELGFVRTNHGSGRTELVTWHGAPNYTTLLAAALTGYPTVGDPENVTPLALDVNGDGIDELGFVRTNHGSGQTEIVVWHGSPNYTTLYSATLTGYPAIGDPQNVTPLAIHLPS